jgi:hypothetical protein
MEAGILLHGGAPHGMMPYRQQRRSDALNMPGQAVDKQKAFYLIGESGTAKQCQGSALVLERLLERGVNG